MGNQRRGSMYSSQRQSVTPLDLQTLPGMTLSSDDQELYYEDERIPKKWYIVRADNTWRQALDGCIMGGVLWNCMFIPFDLAYQLTDEFIMVSYINQVVDAIFWLELVLNFFSGYDDAHGNEVVSQERIVKRYLKTYFFIDLLACFPFDVLINVLVPESTFNQAELIRAFGDTDAVRKFFVAALKCTRLLRIVKLIKKMEKIRNDSSTFRLLKLLFYYCMAMHIFACSFYAIGISQIGGNLLSGRDKWPYESGITDALRGTRHVKSMYWAFVTLGKVGYGDLVPGTNPERSWTILIMIVGAAVYASIFANVRLVISRMGYLSDRKEGITESVSAYINFYGLPVKKQQWVHDVINLHWGRTQFWVPHDVLSILPRPVIAAVSIELYGEWLRKVSCFEGLSERFLAEVAKFLTPQSALAGDVIVQEGDIIQNMCFVRSGQLRSAQQTTYSTVTIAVLGSDDIFGEAAAVKDRDSPYLRSSQITALSNTSFFSIRREDLQNIMRRHRSSAKAMTAKLLNRLHRFSRLRQAHERAQARLHTHNIQELLRKNAIRRIDKKAKREAEQAKLEAKAKAEAEAEKRLTEPDTEMVALQSKPTEAWTEQADGKSGQDQRLRSSPNLGDSPVLASRHDSPLSQPSPADKERRESVLSPLPPSKLNPGLLAVGDIPGNDPTIVQVIGGDNTLGRKESTASMTSQSSDVPSESSDTTTTTATHDRTAIGVISKKKKKKPERFGPDGRYGAATLRFRGAVMTIMSGNKMKRTSKPWFIIDPAHPVKRRWDVIVVGFVTFTAFFLPLNLSFEPVDASSPLVTVGIIADSVVATNVLLAFLTAFKDKHGVLIIEPKVVANKYLRGAFFVDLAGLMPIDAFLAGGFQVGDAPHSVRVANLLKLPRLLRVRKVIAFLDRHFTSSGPRMMKLMFLWTLVAHWMACLWYLVGRLQREGNEFTSKTPWIVDQGLCASVIPDPSSPFTDPNNEQWFMGSSGAGGRAEEDVRCLLRTDFETQYIASMYFAVGTLATLGYGDISPQTNTERLASIILIIMAVLASAIILGNMSSIIEQMDRGGQRHREVLDRINYFFKLNAVASFLRADVEKCVDLLWLKHKGYKPDEVLSILPFNLQAKVCLELYGAKLSTTSLLHDLDRSFMKEIVTRVRPSVALPGLPVCTTGDHHVEVHFLISGQIRLHSADGRITYQILRAGSSFGEISLLPSMEMTYSATALQSCNIVSLEQRDWVHILKKFPNYLTVLRGRARARIVALEKRLEDSAKDLKLSKYEVENYKAELVQGESVSGGPDQFDAVHYRRRA